MVFRVVRGWMLAGLLLTGPVVSAEEKELTFFNWKDYMDPVVIGDFQVESRIAVNEPVYNSEAEFRQAMRRDASRYDVVVTSSTTLARETGDGWYRRLDKRQLSQAKFLDSRLLAQLANVDPGNGYAVPYLWGTIGLGVIPEKIMAATGEALPLDTWRLVFDLDYVRKVSRCGIAMVDSPETVFPVALHYLNLPPSSTALYDYQRAGMMLSKVAPFVRRFDNQFVNDFAEGKYCVVLGASGDVLLAAARAERSKKPYTIRYVIPKEGTSLWFDVLAIPARAKHPGYAHAFINYVLRYRNMAQISNYVAYANPVPVADSEVYSDIRDNPGIYPSQQVRATLFTTTTGRAQDALREQLWSRIRAGH